MIGCRSAADIAVAGEHDGIAVGGTTAKPSANALAEIVKPPERRRPRHGTNTATGFQAVAEVGPLGHAALIAAAMAVASMISSPSGSSGAITGTLRSGSVSSGDTKIVEPETCTVYCEAPITVARMRASGRASCGPSLSRARSSAASCGPMSRKLLASPP